jgi:hypothetical protein
VSQRKSNELNNKDFIIFFHKKDPCKLVGILDFDEGTQIKSLRKMSEILN